MTQHATWFERNEEAERLEREGRIDQALELYQRNAQEGCTLSFTYTRMAAILRNQGAHREEAQALQQALAIEKKRGPSKRLVHLKTKLEHAQTLSQRTMPPRRAPQSDTAAGPAPTVPATDEKKGCLSGAFVLIVGLACTGLLLLV